MEGEGKKGKIWSLSTNSRIFSPCVKCGKKVILLGFIILDSLVTISHVN